MFVGITNEPRGYAWGSPTAIAELLGREPSGGPEAELWLGAHPANPSRILAPAAVGGHETLDSWIAAEPDLALGAARRGDTLPFLLKVLAAEQPLSIQAHPSIEQARAGFAREDEAGIDRAHANRNYRDELHKPELAFALSPHFDALVGFRPVSETQFIVHELVAVATSLGEKGAEHLAALRLLQEKLAGEAPLQDTVTWAFSDTEESRAAILAVSVLSIGAPESSSFGREYKTLAEIAEIHPGDPGILVALLLNRLELAQNQAVYLPSGNVHAYLRGLAIEIMAASDNVLRGGLTSKHVDVDELMSVVRWEELPAPVLRPEEGPDGIAVFRPDVPDFLLARVAVGEAGFVHGYRNSGPDFTAWDPEGPAIILVVEGEVQFAGSQSTATLLRGEAAYVTPDEGSLEISGSGIAFIAGVNPQG